MQWRRRKVAEKQQREYQQVNAGPNRQRFVIDQELFGVLQHDPVENFGIESLLLFLRQPGFKVQAAGRTLIDFFFVDFLSALRTDTSVFIFSLVQIETLERVLVIVVVVLLFGWLLGRSFCSR